MEAPEKQEEQGKIAKNYEATMNKLVAIVGGKQNLNPIKRIKKDALGEIVSGLLKEDNEKAQEAIKTELKDLLSKHILLTKEISAKEKELAKLKEDKMKEFNEAAVKLFNKIDNLGELESDFYKALNDVSKS